MDSDIVTQNKSLGWLWTLTFVVKNKCLSDKQIDMNISTKYPILWQNLYGFKKKHTYLRLYKQINLNDIISFIFFQSMQSHLQVIFWSTTCELSAYLLLWFHNPADI